MIFSNLKQRIGLIVLPMVVLLGSCASPKEPTQGAVPGVWNDSIRAAYVAQGKKLAMAGFQALNSTLQARLAEGGPEDAVAACNLLAYPITDSVAALHQAAIRRTSLRVRNPHNRPDEAELAQLQAYQQAWERGDTLLAAVLPLGQDSVWVTVPILLQAQCTVCHGVTGTTLTNELTAVIRQQYPQDEATGFSPGDLRGMWSIRLKR